MDEDMPNSLQVKRSWSRRISKMTYVSVIETEFQSVTDHSTPTTWFTIGVPLIPTRNLELFRDIKPEMNLGRDLDLSGSRDVIGHVSIRFPMHNFL